MKDWKFVLLWAFILISGELILYARYYILFYKPHGPFELIQALHSSALGIRPEDERYGWYYTFQYVGDDTIEDVSIIWSTQYWDRSSNEPVLVFGAERKSMRQMLPGENFTVWTGPAFVDVCITYHKGTETEEIDRQFSIDDALEIIRAEEQS